MSSIRKIVVATDFSAFAERAVNRAAHVARQHAAELHLLHVVRPLDLYPGLSLASGESTRHDEDMQQAEQTRLDAMAAGLSSQFGTAVHTANRLGRAHSEIAAYAHEITADLVVAGSRGESSLVDLFMGSTASRLLRVSRCPVLIVKKPADASYRQVLAAVDFSPGSEMVVRLAQALAGEARLDILHVLGSEVEQRLRKARLDQVDIAGWLARLRDGAEQQLQALLATIEHSESLGHAILPGFAPAAICQCIEENRVDLVVLGRHGHGGGLQDWLLGSVSKDVAHAAACDVLLINPGG